MLYDIVKHFNKLTYDSCVAITLKRTPDFVQLHLLVYSKTVTDISTCAALPPTRGSTASVSQSIPRDIILLLTRGAAANNQRPQGITDAPRGVVRI